jgi:hypothetical protein
MTNIKKKEFYNCVTGCVELGNNYGYYATVFKKTVNVDMIYDSRGEYLGLRTCRGSIENKKYVPNKGIRDFKSFTELYKLWNGQMCVQNIQTENL